MTLSLIQETMGSRVQGSKHHFSCFPCGQREKNHRRVLDRKRSDTNLLPEHQRLIASVNVLSHILT